MLSACSRCASLSSLVDIFRISRFFSNKLLDPPRGQRHKLSCVLDRQLDDGVWTFRGFYVSNSEYSAARLDEDNLAGYMLRDRS